MAKTKRRWIHGVGPTLYPTGTRNYNDPDALRAEDIPFDTTRSIRDAILSGIPGLTGPQGETGISGDTGLQGPTGVDGIQGDTGLQGVTGPSGIGQTGLQGPTGVQGTQGDTGAQGDTGIQGQTGLQGVTGFQGDTGLQGDTGIQGQTGAEGQTGLQGATGLQGVTGFQGNTGFQGATGLQGDTGLKGDTGIQGQTGAQPQVYWDRSDSWLYPVFSGDSVGIDGDATIGLDATVGQTLHVLGDASVDGTMTVGTNSVKIYDENIILSIDDSTTGTLSLNGLGQFNLTNTGHKLFFDKVTPTGNGLEIELPASGQLKIKGNSGLTLNYGSTSILSVAAINRVWISDSATFNNSSLFEVYGTEPQFMLSKANNLRVHYLVDSNDNMIIRPLDGGYIAFDSDATVSSDMTVGEKLHVIGDSTIGGNLKVDGTAQIGSGTLTIDSSRITGSADIHIQPSNLLRIDGTVGMYNGTDSALFAVNNSADLIVTLGGNYTEFTSDIFLNDNRYLVMGNSQSSPDAYLGSNGTHLVITGDTTVSGHVDIVDSNHPQLRLTAAAGDYAELGSEVSPGNGFTIKSFRDGMNIESSDGNIRINSDQVAVETIVYADSGEACRFFDLGLKFSPNSYIQWDDIDSTNNFIYNDSGNEMVINLVLPTSDPNIAGRLWNENGVVTVSDGVI